MFSDKISIFRSFDSDPKVITLGRWIRSTMNSKNSFAEQVLRYRQTGDSQLKKSLPLATVGALCEGGRKREDVTRRTGWIPLDIDAKDNPEMEDAAELRDTLSKIVYVAFAGLSVSGNGVWALVKVEDPARQRKYFDQLQHDFTFWGISLDPTKGKNPNDARFYSYDPDAYVADSFEIYERLPKEKVTSNRSKSTSRSEKIECSGRYAEAALNDELEKLSRTANGNRNNQLFKSTASLAELVAGGVLQKSDVATALHDTARSIGLPKYEIDATINSGFRAGRQNPRTPAKNSHTKPLQNKDNGSAGNYETKKIKLSTEQPKKDYPPEWDDISLTKGTQEWQEATRHAINDANEEELEELHLTAR